jgi:hypothetical protein
VASKPTDKYNWKQPRFLKEKATGNHALDSYAYSRWPHLFNVLALKYNVPDSFILTLLFLWDRTVGSGEEEAGDCALSQIPVNPRWKKKWIAALVAAGFFTCTREESGGRNQRGAFYVYNNPPAEAWAKFFFSAGNLCSHPRAVAGIPWNKLPTERFARLFCGLHKPEDPSNDGAATVEPALNGEE